MDLTFEKMSFMSKFVLLDPKLAPHVNFSNFKAHCQCSYKISQQKVQKASEIVKRV